MSGQVGVEKAVRLLEGRESCTLEISQRWTGAARTARTRVIIRRGVDIESKKLHRRMEIDASRIER